MLTLLLAAAALAQEPSTDPAWTALLDEAAAMERAGERDLARATLEFVVAADAPEAVEAEAKARLAHLPPSRAQARIGWAKVATWQAAWMGAGVGSWAESHTWEEGTIWGATLAGGAVGVATTAAWARGPGLTPTRVTTLVGLQQAGLFHGAAVAIAAEVDDEEALPLILLGGIGGTLAAIPATAADLDDDLVVGAHTGAFYGLGLGAAALTMTYQWEAPPAVVMGVLVAGTDLGAAGGAFLAPRLDIDRDQLRMAKMGAVFGGASAYCFAWASQNNILWTDAAVMGAVTVGALAGSTGGALLVRRYHGDVELAASPTLAWDGDRASIVPGLHGRF